MIIFTSRLEHKTRELLAARSRDLTYADIAAKAEQLGGDIKPLWLTSFMNTPNQGFSVAKVELLYLILSGDELKL